jgi:hypothetical protein
MDEEMFGVAPASRNGLPASLSQDVSGFNDLESGDLLSLGPNEASLQRLLAIATRVPDHSKLASGVFSLVIAGIAKHRLVLANQVMEWRQQC